MLKPHISPKHFTAGPITEFLGSYRLAQPVSNFPFFDNSCIILLTSNLYFFWSHLWSGLIFPSRVFSASLKRRCALLLSAELDAIIFWAENFNLPTWIHNEEKLFPIILSAAFPTILPAPLPRPLPHVMV